MGPSLLHSKHASDSSSGNMPHLQLHLTPAVLNSATGVPGEPKLDRRSQRARLRELVNTDSLR